MTVDAGSSSSLVSQDGPLSYLADWAAAFASAGTALVSAPATEYSTEACEPSLPIT